MGRPKALLPWKLGTFLSGAIHSLTNYTDLVIVVAGHNVKQIQPIVDTNAAYLVVNPEPDRGQFSSLQIGLQEVLNRGRDAAIVTLVDRPPAKLETVRYLLDQFLYRIGQSEIWAAVPEFEGQHGHPIVIGREVITRVLDAPITGNARDIMHGNQSRIVYVPVKDPLVAMNIDTLEDYERVIAQYQEISATR